MFPQTKTGKFISIVFVLVCVILFSVLTVYLQVMALEKPFMYYLEQGLQIQRHTAIPHPIASAFVSFRFVQNLLIFVLAYLYYRRLGLSSIYALLGLALLAWGMTYAYYDSDLQFNTYFDIIFYLLAGLIVLAARPL